MAIDPSIPLQGRPVQMPSPMETVGQFLSLRDLLQRGRANELAIQEQQRRLEEERRVQQAVAAAGGDIRAALPAVTAASPATGIAFGRQLGEQDRALLDRQKTELELAAQRAKRFGSLAQSVLSAKPSAQENLYPLAVNQAVAEGLLNPEQASRLPKRWGAEAYALLTQTAQGALTANEQIQAIQKEIDQALAQKKHEEDVRAARVREAREPEGTTEVQLALRAAQGDKVAAAALDQLEARRAQRARGSATAEAARIRERTAEADRRATDIRTANRLLTTENLRREREGLPPLNSPPGTELSQLEKTAQGSGVRRWGYGRKLPAWLAEQYLQQANGDKDVARQWADADGWDRFR